MHELEASLARIRSAWMAGRSALEYCPDEWREAVAGQRGEWPDASRERRSHV